MREGGWTCYDLGMIILSNGSRFIVCAHSQTGGRKRYDVWYSHGVYTENLASEPCSSGRYIVYIEWILTDGQQFYYPTKFFPGISEAGAYLEANQGTAHGSRGDYPFGEMYNGGLRQMAFAKVNAADWPAWLAAN